jgi:dTMP kinase
MAFIGKLWAIYVLSFVIECFSLLWGPARDASLPNMVPRRQLANANSLVLVSAYATLPIGGAAFAVLYAIAVGMSARVPILATHPESLALVFDAATSRRTRSPQR